MSAPLGPCPACGGKEDWQGWCIGRRLFIQCASCDFSCVEAHWNTMHRKMTQAECAVMMKPLTSRMYYDDEPETNACFAAIRAALTGEKP